MNSFTHHNMKYPYGIAIHGDSLYVSDVGVRAMFRFKLGSNIELVSKIGTYGSGIGQFNRPLNIAISNNGDVCVVDSRNNRIAVLDSSLQRVRTLTQQKINRLER